MQLEIPFQELELGESHTFDYRQSGKLLDGFVIKHREGYSAYQNVCAHIPVALDYDDGDFYSDTLGRIVCKTHGATFRSEDGFCDSGPCAGQSLIRFALEVTPDRFIVEIPDP
jgi:nitrite reductase/ring-hydroxylating ferredoxin subunit